LISLCQADAVIFHTHRKRNSKMTDTQDPPDPFDPARLRVSATSDEALGVERPLLNVPVTKPNKKSFVRAHPDPDMTLLARILDYEDTIYLLTPDMAAILVGESKLVALTACLPRQGGIFLWPVPVTLEGDRANAWHITARQANELAKTKWVRVQANLTAGQYDVLTSSSIPDPVWPKHSMRELLAVAFSGGRLIDSIDHPVVRQLNGQV
jgi:hypothetical protein